MWNLVGEGHDHKEEGAVRDVQGETGRVGGIREGNRGVKYDQSMSFIS
jgi:hypothetical protein